VHSYRVRHSRAAPTRPGTALRDLVGSGDRIALATAPFAIAGLALNIAVPSVFDVGGPSDSLRAISIGVLVVGIVVWAWSVALIVTRVPRGQLITTGPFRVVTHPLYTGVALLVIPWVGFLLNTWLGLALGIVLYLASRRYAPEEEAVLAVTFGEAWNDYRRSVMIPWI
jgi:protein-S-isoprenylcysteine O-methyltransferase Ste14